MIEGELINKLRKLPKSYDDYFNSLSMHVKSDLPIKLPELPEEFSSKKLGKEIAAGTSKLEKISEEELRDISDVLKIGFAYLKINKPAPLWAAYYKRGL